MTAHLASLSLGTARVREREGGKDVHKYLGTCPAFGASYPLPFLLAYKGVGVKWNCLNVRMQTNSSRAELGDWEEARKASCDTCLERN